MKEKQPPAPKDTAPKKDLYEIKVKPYLDDIKHYVAHGVTEGQLCTYYGVGKTVWVEYKKNYPELTETLLNARAIHKTELVNRSHQIATGYDYTETTVVEYFNAEGVKTGSRTTTVTKHSKANANMAQFLLLNRYSEDYARDPQILELRREVLELKKQLSNKNGMTEGV